VTVLCANGADAAVAAEAAFVARVSGTEVARIDDLPAARVHELAADPSLTEADCLVVVAGLDASLPAAVAAAVDVPVVAVATSAGRPGALGGLGALMAVLGGPAGVAATNVDDGHAAGVFAARVARQSHRRPPADDRGQVPFPG
jgi:NCAIR mutase (PurE)-related protein